MLLSRSFFLGGGGRRLQTAHITSRTSSSGSNSHVYSGINLGDEHPGRIFYLMYAARTNSTTGARKLNTARFTIGGVQHNFSYINDSGNQHNPRGIMELVLPEGTSGTLTLIISGNSTGWVSGLVTIWSARGRFERIDQGRSSSGSINLDTEQGGAFLHQAANFAQETLGSPSNIVNDTNRTLNGLTARSGRNVSTPSGSLTVSTNNAQNSMGITLAQR